MREPNTTILALARRLFEVGFPQEIDTGDWFYLDGTVILCAYSNEGWHKWLEKDEASEVFVIPSISQVGDWLRERGEKFFPYLFEPEPHETAMEAAINILEKEKEA